MLIRRNFLKSIVAFAPLNPHLCLFAKSPSAAQFLQKKEWDFVIAGGGASGLSAAVAAAEHGLKNVLVVEKEPILGGASILSEGVWSLAGTDMQKASGILDSADRFYENLIQLSRNTCDPDLVRAYVDHCLPVYEWFKQQEITAKNIIKNSGMNTPRGHSFDPIAVLNCLRVKANHLGVCILTNAKIEAFFKEEENIRGAVINFGQSHFPVRSRCGVLLATGGFSRSEELIERYAPSLLNAVRLSAPGATGDGLRLALKEHAALRDIDNVRAAYGFVLNPSSVLDHSQVIYAGAISVNIAGHRYVNESLPYKDIGPIALAQPYQKTFMVFDSKILRSQIKAREADAMIYAPLLKGESVESMYTAATLEEVAASARIPVKTFVNEVHRYNLFVRDGFDRDFGRKNLTSTYGQMQTIDTPPFYIVASTCASMGTNGGVAINSNTEVLREDGSVIPNLFATGEMIGGFHGQSFMGGTSYGKALVFGRLSGLRAAGVI